MIPTKRLDQVASIIMGQAPAGESYNTTGEGWPLIAGAGDFKDGKLAPVKHTTQAAKLSEPGDIILSIRASIGDKVTADGIYCLGRGVAGIRASQLLSPRYLWHWLASVEAELANKGKGATFKQVNRSDIGELRIPMPSLAEQKRIAEILDQADALIAERRRSVPLLDELAKSVFLDMFGDIHDDGMAVLGDYLTFVTSGGRGWAKYYSDSGSRFIRSLDVRMNEIDDGSAVYVSPPNNAEARRTRVQSGDVLLTITGSLIGRVAPVSSDLEGSYVSQHVAILRPDASRLDSGFLAFFLSIPSKGQRQVARLQYGQTKPGLNFEQIRKMRIPLPDIRQQQLFAERLCAVRRTAESGCEHLEGLKRLAASIQHRAFSGEL